MCTMNEYVTIKEIAQAKGLKSTRSIRMEINKPESKYISREVKVNGGISYEILFSSLEPELQQKLRECETKSTAIVPLNYKPPIITDKARQTANHRMNIVKAALEHRNKYPSIKEADAEFLDLYNSGLYLPKAYEFLGRISIGTLRRYIQAYKKTGNAESLIPQYKITKQGEYNSILDDNMKKVLLVLLLHQNKFGYNTAIRLAKQVLIKKGYDEDALPSNITFKRFAEHFRRNHYAEWVLRREGMKAYHDKVEPYIERDISKIEVGDVLIADGHVLNFQVINPFTGKPTRATLVGFLDWKSTALVGYEIMMTENTQCIASALRNAILNLGIIPKVVYQDNGKAFKSKFFQNADFDEGIFNGVYANLGTLDEISTIAEDIDESVLELLLLTLVQEGKLIFKDNIYLYNKEQGCNKQRLPQFFQHHSKTDIDYIIKGFCIDIEVLKMIDLFGFSKHVMNNFYQYFRTIIYEQQKNELVKYFEKSPKIPQERIYMNTKVYPSLQELYLSGEVNLEDWNYIIKSLFSLHKKFEKFKGETNPDAIKWLYYDKTKERLSDLRAQNPYWNEVLDREFEYINGKKYRGIASLKSGIDIYVQKLCKTGKETVIHGDYCFSNILFDSSNYNFKLVDPRGRLNNEPTIYGDPRYDIAKLRHSIAGFYDFIVHGLFRLKENKTGFEYEIKTSVDYSILEMIFNKYAELNGYNPQEIKFIEGLLFLSMIPLHKDNFSRQKVFYLKAIELLNDTVKIRGKLNNEKVLSLVRSRG